MYITMLKSKIHCATLTEANIEYEGSIEIDEDLMDASGIISYEKVLVSNCSNASRFETYVIPGKRGSGCIGLNGAAARLGMKGDKVIIFAFVRIEEKEGRDFKPSIVLVNDDNSIKKIIK